MCGVMERNRMNFYVIRLNLLLRHEIVMNTSYDVYIYTMIMEQP